MFKTGRIYISMVIGLVMGDDSDVIVYDRRTSGLSNAAINMKPVTNSKEI